MRMAIEWIGPEIARRYLERNTRNRKVKKGSVGRLARDIVSGKFVLSHQGIAFDSTGVLIDGQHRLLAILECGIAVEMAVFYDVSPDAYLVIDGGVGRSVFDVATVSGMDVGKEVFAIVRSMMRGYSATVKTPTRAESLEFYERHKEAVTFVIEAARPVWKVGISRAPVLAAISRAFYHVDHQRLSAFVTVLHTVQATDSATDSAALLLNQYLLAHRTLGGDTSATYRKTERAIKAFANGEALDKLYEASKELFPLKDDAE